MYSQYSVSWRRSICTCTVVEAISLVPKYDPGRLGAANRETDNWTEPTGYQAEMGTDRMRSSATFFGSAFESGFEFSRKTGFGINGTAYIECKVHVCK